MASITVQVAIKGSQKVFKEVEREQSGEGILITAQAVLDELNEGRGKDLKPLVLLDAWMTDQGKAEAVIIDGDAEADETYAQSEV